MTSGSTEQFLAELGAAGVKVWLEGDELRAGTRGADAAPALVEQLRARKAEVVAFLQALRTGDALTPPPLVPRSGGDRVPLSFGQQRLWLINELGKGFASPFDTVAIPLAIDGEIDRDALRRALSEIVRRHEILRTTFAFENDAVNQVVHPPRPVAWEETDLRDIAAEEREVRCRELLRAARGFVFDLQRGPLFRARLIRRTSRDQILVIMVHHIVFDGWSMSVLFREIGACYAACRRGDSPALPPLRVQYADYAVWQRAWLRDEVLDQLLAYWRERLAGLQKLELASDRPRPPLQSHRGASMTRPLSEPLACALRNLAQASGVSVFTVNLALLMALLHRYSGQTDIAIGTPITDRDRPELQALIGFFLNTLVVRADLGGDPPFAELLARVQRSLHGAFAHKHLPFERLVEALEQEREPSRNPLFDVGFAMHGSPTRSEIRIDGLAAQTLKPESQTSRFDLEIYVWEVGDGLTLSIDYSTDLFDADSIARMGAHFETLAASALAAPETPLSRLAMMSATERTAIVEGWNATRTDYPRERCVHAIFAETARAAPLAEALRYGDAALSYGELDARANRLARRLAARGAAPGTVVGVHLERGPDLIVALLAILKAGACYLPLDLDHPAARLAYMLEDSGALLLVSHSTLGGRLPDFSGGLVEIDREQDLDGGADDGPPAVTVRADDLAYVIYTSGSTGQPKGVAVTHRGIVRLVCATDYLQLGPKDHVAQASNVSFDAATFEIWGALLNGAQLCGVPKAVLINPAALGELLREEDISVMFVTTAVFNLVAREQPAAFGTLRALLFGGERVDAGAVRCVLDNGPPDELLHVYGPTESTTFATCQRVDTVAADADNIPIGRPIANTTAYVLDAAREPVPVGVPGELYLGGDGLAAGYLGRPELSAERFVDVGLGGGGRLYRTGDRVRYRSDGAIEFLGRFDDQVKIRGFRIEPGEVAAALRELPGIADAAVLALEDGGDRRLLAWFTAADGARPAPGEVREGLKQAVPAYMVPASITAVDAIPVTANGKIDRAALLASRASTAEPVAAAPLGELEQSIATIWCEVLGVDQVGLRDNFFDLGGHSLLLVRTHARLRATLGCKLALVDLFEHPTVEALARFLRRDRPQVSVAERAAARVSRRRQAVPDAQPIAIVGMAGRFPGADDVETLWRNLCDGVESITFFKREELLEAGVPAAMIDHPDYVPARGYLPQADLFDAAFFGYSAREAAMIDPQQRILLECAAQTLERAGYDPDRYPGLIGVFAGASMSGYHLPLYRQAGSGEAAGGLTRVLGGSRDFVATRLSYKLNLRGPSMNVQTACSTSLVAVHQACRALAEFECDMALAGGASAITPLKSGYLFVEDSIGSRDGHCRAFDADASGTVGGSGVAMVLLKRLDDALADGDHVHAVVLGTAVNNDGANKVGYTAPSVEGQAEVIAMAQAVARCSPDTIDYVEAHGTGTALGDPIEIAALRRVFGGPEGRTRPCRLGSLKTNLGHLDAAAGVAGLIKAALSLEHRQMVPSLHYREANPEIDFGGCFEVNTALTPWPDDPGAPRRAAVSSFGLGGSNAHAVLEQAPPRAPAAAARRWQLVCLSARGARALAAASENLAAHFERDAQMSLADAAYTLQVGRREFAERRITVCRDAAEACAALRGEPTAPAVVDGRCRAGERAVVFMFTGQGAQYAGMGSGLYAGEPVYRDVIDECSERLQPRLGLDLRELLYPDGAAARAAAEASLTRTELAQPALFATEMALARWWMAVGVTPRALIGHSIGEYAAACVAGVMSMSDALGLVAERGRMMGSLPGGAMLAVGLGPAALTPRLGPEISIAAVNQPELCVAAGPVAPIAELAAALDADGIRTHRLRTSHAFHSSMMDPILEAFTEQVAAIELRAPELPYVSNLSGTWIDPAQATDPGYYARHLRNSVRFADGLATLLADPDHEFLEIGPGSTLASLVRGHPAHDPAQLALPSLPPRDAPEDDQAFVLGSLGRLWLGGVRPDWQALHAPHARRRVLLPTYPFERRRYTLDGVPAAAPPTHAESGDEPSRWCYVTSWQRLPVPPRAARADGERWLCLRDAGGLVARIEDDLRQRGASVVSVEAGDRFARADDRLYTLDPACPDHYTALLEALAAANARPTHVLHGWSVYPGEETATDAAKRERRRTRGFYALLGFARAAAADMPSRAVEITVLTSQTREVTGGEPLCADNALVSGACRAVELEYPGMHCREIDLVPPAAARDRARLAGAIVAELGSADAAPVTAYRGGFRWRQSFEPLDLAPADDAAPVLRRHGVYLISGGLGALGLALAGRLAVQHAARLVLVGRSGLPPRARWPGLLAAGTDPRTCARIERVMALEEAGAEVLVTQADVADPVQLEAAVAAAEARFGALNGVIHTAGAERRANPVATLERAACEAQFRPRTEALRALAAVLAGRTLDFVAVNSSLAAVLGVVDFAAYAAAHAGMDAFVLQQARSGDTPWLSIDWDNWQADDDREQARPGAPTPALTADQGVELFSAIVARARVPQVLVSTRDLNARRRQWQVAREESATDADEAAASAATRYPRPELACEFRAPGNDTERALAAIWCAILGLETVGVDDNFFELGGDSVLNLQITARAADAGIALTQKQIFEHQTIAELAAVAGTAAAPAASDEPVSGAVPLTPVQHWFFERGLSAPQHFNLPLLVEVAPPLTPDTLEAALTRLLAHHDALRTRFHRTADGWMQQVEAAVETPAIEIVDLADAAAEERARLMQAHADALQASLDLAHAPLLRGLWFDCGAEQPARLLLAVHHLVVDVVSWRVLLADLETLCTAPARGSPPALPPKTTSFKHWAEALAAHAASAAATAELVFWQRCVSNAAEPLPLDFERGANIVAATDTVYGGLDAETTRALTGDAPRAAGTSSYVILLSALAEALSAWTGRERVLVDLEGHGREPILDGLDVSRTVGWFTNVFPLALEPPAPGGVLERLRAIGAQYGAVPAGGIGYGVLRYLHPDAAIRAALTPPVPAGASFLYLGHLDAAAHGGRVLRPCAGPTGPARDPGDARAHLLEINTVVENGKLRSAWTYSRNHHRRETVTALAAGFDDALRALIAASLAAPAAPSDLSADGISNDDLAEILGQQQR